MNPENIENLEKRVEALERKLAVSERTRREEYEYKRMREWVSQPGHACAG